MRDLIENLNLVTVPHQVIDLYMPQDLAEPISSYTQLDDDLFSQVVLRH